jgi:Polysaccharide lyase
VNCSPSRPLSLLIALLLTVCLAVPATAAATSGRAGASATQPSHGKARAAIGAGRAARRHNRHLMRIRRRKAERRAIGLKNGVAVGAGDPAEDPAVLFRGDFDAGFAGWHLQSLPERATLVSSGAYQGSQAARFEVRDGDVEPETGSQRSEVSGPIFNQGEDLYIGDAIRLPAGNTYSVPWQIVQQLHEEDWSGSPGMAVMLDNKHALELGSGDGSRTFWQGPSLQAERWYDLVYRVNLSQDPSTGFVEVWLDGAQQTLANGQTRMYGETIQAAQTYLKAGIYRSKSSSGTSIVEHDAIAVGTSYAAAAAG